MHVRVEIVHLGVADFGEERERTRSVRPRRVELDGGCGAAADDDDGAVGEDLVSGVPAAGEELGGVELLPVAGRKSVIEGAGAESADLLEAVLVAAGLEKSAVGEELAGGAPGVGLDLERAELAGGGVEVDGVRVAVQLGEELIGGVDAAARRRELQPGRADVGAVEQHHRSEARDGAVHGRDAGVLHQQLPCPWKLLGGGGGEEESCGQAQALQCGGHGGRSRGERMEGSGVIDV